MKIIIFIIVICFISFFLTYLIKKIANHYRILNLPNERSLHTIPTPRLGGIAIIICWYPGITFLYLYELIEKNLFLALISGIAISIVSLIDDLKSLPATLRLIVHIASSILAFYFLNGLRPFMLFEIKEEYMFLTYPIIILGMVWFINLFNFMDGVDGFASNEAITIALILLFFTGNIINILLIACISGFLFWNWPKAKIFMGDIGSTQLGFILIVLGLYFHNNLQFSILNWLMLAGPFWFDATYTLYRRWRNGEKISQAHKKHAYQRLVQMGFSHKTVNLLLMLLNIFIVSMIIIYRANDSLKLPLTILTIIGLYVLYKRIDKRIPF